jgi:hypothetical protein
MTDGRDELEMRRTVLGFSLRSTESVSAEALAKRIQDALEITLTKGEYHRFSAYVGTALGMTIALFPWGGPNDTMLFILEGEVEDAAFVMYPDGSVRSARRLDVSDAIADLLNVRSAGNWHRPTAEELTAHSRYSREHQD